MAAAGRKPIAQVARELGINEGTLGNWCAQDRRQNGESGGPLGEAERTELIRCDRFGVNQPAAHLRMHAERER